MIEERVDEFVLEKYIEIIKGIMYKVKLIQILTLSVLLDNAMIGIRFIYI